MDESHQQFMQQALLLANRAEQQDEVPIGAVLVHQGEIIGEGWNQSITLNDPTAHAEIMAIRDAAKKIKNYRLSNTTLYVTLEPCSMCAGSLIHARVEQVIFGAKDQKAGAVESVHHLLDSNDKQHRVKWQGGVLEDECSSKLTQFFAKKRAAKKTDQDQKLETRSNEEHEG
jgi:tRNA(adenine34) deaminase